jgi:hypothetical protein
LLMNKFIFAFIALLVTIPLFGSSKVSPKIDKNVMYELNIHNNKYYLIPAEKEHNALNYQPDPNAPNPCIGSLICYKCCTGDNDIPKETCEKTFKNWNKGKECNCT